MMFSLDASSKNHKRRVGLLSIAILSMFMAFVFINPEGSTNSLGAAKNWISINFSWFYMSAVVVFILILAYSALSRAGNLRLGKEYDRPEFSHFAWGAMLFCTGMGIGLVFFGVAEPVMHYTSPPVIGGETDAAVRNAMKITFFHWGISAWAIYAIVALVISYAAYRKGLPIEMRSALYPIFKERIYGPIGDMIDTFAVLATIVGIVTPLGFGVIQINSGLSYLFNIPDSTAVQIALVLGISGVTCTSLLLGLKKGIKRLSLINMAVAIGLMIFVFLFGKSAYILNATVENIGDYASSLVPLSFETYSYTNPEWFRGWTLFYWAWWIAFAAPTGIFIARISKGRTIREFVFGVLIIPVGFSFAWLSVFGNTALDLIHNSGLESLQAAVMADSSTALFQFFEIFSEWKILSYIALFCIFVFFITTADSGTMVVNILTSPKEDQAPGHERVFWVLVEAGITSLLLLIGGMTAIQSTLIILGFPFAWMIAFMCAGFIKSISEELKDPRIGRTKESDLSPSSLRESFQ